MKIRSRLALIFIVLSIAVGALAFISVRLLYSVAKPIEKEIPASIDRANKTAAIDGLIELIRYDDEVLTQSARNYAYTRKKEWMQRYFAFEPELSKAIEQGQQKGGEEHRIYFDRIAEANNKLTKMEHESIDLIARGSADSAIKILESDEYQDHKQEYEAAMRDYFSVRGLHYDQAYEASVFTIRMAAKETSAKLHESMRLTLGVIIFVFVLLVFSGAYVIRSIVDPVRLLTQHANRIAQGELDLRAPVSSPDELGDLARSFNTMTQSLQRSRSELQKRTHELETTNGEMANEIIERRATEEKLKNTQTQLVHTEKLAGIGQLAAGVAHEINNPVGYVLGNTETLAEYFAALKNQLQFYETNPTPEQLKEKRVELDIDYILSDVGSLLQDNIQGLHRVVEIVANLKDFARTGQKSDWVEADIEENLRSTLLVARNEIKYCAEVKTVFAGVSHVRCNIGELNQVFLNIIINSAQAIAEQHRPEKGMIKVETREDESNVYCLISDDGPGMPENVRQKIFDPFFTTKPIGKGTGLGLSIAWDIVINRHKGAIAVDSEVGKGACFTIRLPKGSAATEAAEGAS